MKNATPRRPRSRSRALAVLLLVTLALTCAIGWEARRAAAAEQRIAEGVLRDYAGFAAAEFARVAAREVRAAADATLSQLSCAAGTNGIDGALAAAAAPCDCARLAPVRTFFRIGEDGRWTAGGEPLPAGVRDVVGQNPQNGHARHLRIELLDVAGHRSVVAWRSDADRGIVGLVADTTALDTVFASAARSRLLPATLLDAGTRASVLALRVRGADGALIHANPVEESTFAGTAVFDPGGGGSTGLTAVASLAPEAAGSLIIGGLPRSRMPIVYGLLALSAALVVLAFIQIRRETELNRLRTEFVAGVSHELRTPLAQIRMFAETLALDRVRSEDERRHSLDVVVRESHRLSLLVDRVLLFTRADRGAPLDRQDIDFPALVRDTCAAFAPLAAARGSRLRVDTTPGVVVHGEGTALAQVLLNLLDNAVKYGRADQTVGVTTAVDGDSVIVSVEDEGPGIAEADRAHAWKAFWRAPGSPEGGSGIGLSIVERLVALHGGRAWIEDGAAGGARVCVRLPATIAPALDRVA